MTALNISSFGLTLVVITQRFENTWNSQSSKLLQWRMLRILEELFISGLNHLVTLWITKRMEALHNFWKIGFSFHLTHTLINCYNLYKAMRNKEAQEMNKECEKSLFIVAIEVDMLITMFNTMVTPILEKWFTRNKIWGMQSWIL